MWVVVYFEWVLEVGYLLVMYEFGLVLFYGMGVVRDVLCVVYLIWVLV